MTEGNQPTMIVDPDILFMPGDIKPFTAATGYVTEETGDGHAQVFVYAVDARAAAVRAAENTANYLIASGCNPEEMTVWTMLVYDGHLEAAYDANEMEAAEMGEEITETEVDDEIGH